MHSSFVTHLREKCHVIGWTTYQVHHVYNISSSTYVHWLISGIKTFKDVVPLNPSGHCTYHKFNIHHFCILPTQYTYVNFVWIWEQQLLIPYTTLTDWLAGPLIKGTRLPSFFLESFCFLIVNRGRHSGSEPFRFLLQEGSLCGGPFLSHCSKSLMRSRSIKAQQETANCVCGSPCEWGRSYSGGIRETIGRTTHRTKENSE
jgi:hypothetical protein